MLPTEMLKHEHEIILLVLQAAEREARSIQETGKVRTDDIEKMLEFFTHFVDHCHHKKEEDYLFLKLQELGMPREAGPLAVMLHEHEDSRRRLVAVQDALPDAAGGGKIALETVRANLCSYTVLLRNHIRKENEVLYPMADSMLTDDDQRILAEAFARFETEEMGEGVHERYHQLAHALAEC